MENILNFGINFIQSFQGLGEWLAGPMSAITFLGSEWFFLFFLPILYWSVDAKLGIRVGVILLVNGAVNDAFKLLLHGPRPYWYNPAAQAHAAETSFGVPSGHSQIAAGVWGMVAAYVKKWWAWLAAVLLVLLIGLSRLFLAVHFPHDVLLGWTIGAIVLALTLWLWIPITNWLKKLSTGGQVSAAFVFSLVMILINLIPFLWLKVNWVLPAEWIVHAGIAFPDGEPINPVTLDGALTNAGTFFGLATGLALLWQKGGFKSQGTLLQRTLRFIVGLVGVMILYFGLKAIFPSGDTWLPYVFRYARYVLVGLWVSAGAPYAFKKMKLA